MSNPIIFSLVILLVLLATCSVVVYFSRKASYNKGEYGKQTVHSALVRYASPRKMTVLQDVSLSDGGKTMKFDHVLIGYFGVLFLQSIQGEGSFWGDGKEDTWAFTNSKSEKILFRNPLDEMEERIKFFRRVLSQNKIYNVPVDGSVVIVTLGKESKLYLSNIRDSGSLIMEKELSDLLRQEKWEKDNGVDADAVKALFK